MGQHRAVTTVCLAAFVGSSAALTTAQDSPTVGRTVQRDTLSPKVRLAVDNGFRHLLRKKRRSGEFDDEVPVAATALVGLAFLAGGYTERCGPESYSAAVRSCTDALIARQRKCGYFADGKSRMYGHGFATLYFAQLYGMSRRRERIHDVLKRAVAVIEKSQGRDGGWDYEPHEGCGGHVVGGSDTSITVCQTMALRAARNLGFAVNANVISRARRYIQSAQNADGGFGYRRNPGDPPLLAESAFPRSAAGVCILYSLGDYNSSNIRRGFEYLEKHYESWNLFPYYAHYYCSQAMFQAGGRSWRNYFDVIQKEILRQQRPDGGWKASQRENDTQATAMALIVLQLPRQLLPIFER